MKADKLLGVLIVAAFVALGLVYALLTQQDQVAGRAVEALRLKVDGFDVSLKKIEAEVKASAESVKGIEEKMSAGDVEKRNITATLEAITKDIEQLQNDMKASVVPKEVNVSVAPAIEIPLAPAVVPPVALESEKTIEDLVPIASEGAAQ